MPVTGLGSGLLVGYGIGMLSRPAGFGTPGYGYNYYHRGRKPLKVSEHLECVVANYTLYTKVHSANFYSFVNRLRRNFFYASDWHQLALVAQVIEIYSR